jgi:beta-glucanase (GH16 family)
MPAVRSRRRLVVALVAVATGVGLFAVPPIATGATTATCGPMQKLSGHCTPDPVDTNSPPEVSPATTAAPTCGGEQVTKPNGTPWVCRFDDEFSGTSIDPSKWVTVTTADSGFTSGNAPYLACYEDSPNNVSESGGYLHLTVRKEAARVKCRGTTTQYTAGEVSSMGLFSQTYGRFEVRAQVPAPAVKGLQETFWLWPNNDTKYGSWPGSGEIDFAEFYSKYSDRVIPYIHYRYAKYTADPATNSNTVTNNTGCLIDSGFHDYVVDWEPGTITLSYDGQVCVLDHYAPSNVKSPAPFDQPFFLTLTQALGVYPNSPTTATPLPATTLVDYVRVWS